MNRYSRQRKSSVKKMCQVILTISFIHGEKEKGHHQPDHYKRRRGIADGSPRKEVHRHADDARNGKAYKLPLG